MRPTDLSEINRSCYLSQKEAKNKTPHMNRMQCLKKNARLELLIQSRMQNGIFEKVVFISSKFFIVFSRRSVPFTHLVIVICRLWKFSDISDCAKFLHDRYLGYRKIHNLRTLRDTLPIISNLTFGFCSLCGRLLRASNTAVNHFSISQLQIYKLN